MSEPVVRTDRGQVSGKVTEHGFAFFGIPYAEPPFGALRFRAPVVRSAWTGSRPCVRPAPTAPQPAVGFTLIPEPTVDGGDAPDCLVVNVFTPDLGAAGLPVLVWIHGGGFTNGTPSSTWYDGSRFARDGVVVVSVGYRLGAEGFLDIPGFPANRGVLDWIAALEWVQRNIASFGGDPSLVTVGGQSAGGAATLLLTVLEQARGLFRAAIPMSGSVFPTPSPEEAAAFTAKVAAALGSSDFASATPSALVAAQIEASKPRGFALTCCPTADGTVVPVPPMEALPTSPPIPMLIGATAEEVNAMVPTPTDPSSSPLSASARRALGLSDAAVAFYADNPGQGVTDAMFRVPAVRVATVRPGPTFHYDFRWRTPALGGLGAVHCLDLPFVWDVLDDPHVAVVAGDTPPQGLADTMHRAWVRFITDGDPGWPVFDPSADRITMAFDETSRTVTDALGDAAGLFAPAIA